jgi:hypothetical protein
MIPIAIPIAIVIVIAILTIENQNIGTRQKTKTDIYQNSSDIWAYYINISYQYSQ